MFQILFVFFSKTLHILITLKKLLTVKTQKQNSKKSPKFLKDLQCFFSYEGNEKLL